MKTTQRNYRATFILDNRGKEESIEQIINNVKTEIAAVNATVGAVEDLGRRDFARQTDPKFPAAHYVQIDFSGSAEAPAQLRERLRLNGTVYRTLIQNA